MDSILKNIEAVRKAKHIKQEQIAAELGIKQSSYSSFITRESDITYSECADCKAKDAIIANLNKYIELLEKDRGH